MQIEKHRVVTLAYTLKDDDDRIIDQSDDGSFCYLHGASNIIPGLENAEFARLGGLHRNTFINSPRLLDGELRLKAQPRLRFAGQITGVEGYVESTALGLLAARFAVLEAAGRAIVLPPATTALGALLNHVTVGADAKTFQPMNCNFGLFPPPDRRVDTSDRRASLIARARRDLGGWLGEAEAAE